ncbi:MAG: glycosyltransferase [Chloroflexi bacterium]|nr:glycosyltransferase [Chloroflexota bacterium]
MADSKQYPFVTVIMPIRNEAPYIKSSLGAVLDQTYPRDRVEILVVDGVSNDNTLDYILEMPGADRVTIISNPQRRQASALNLAIPKAKGDIVVRIDGHTIIASDYLEECVKALVEITGAQNVGGPMNPVGTTSVGKAIAAAGKSAFAVPTAFHVSDKAQFTDTVYLGAWWKSTLDQVGLFNETATANEDYEFNYRIRAAGGQIYLSPRIRSAYYGRQSFHDLWTQYFRYGIGKVEILRLFPKSLKFRHLVAPVFLLVLIAGGITAPLHWLLLSLWVGVIAVYLAANLFFSFRVARRVEASVWLWLPAVFFVIHVAWGAGFWFALLKRLVG